MARADRLKIIKELESKRGGTHLLSYVTSTRNGLEVQMAMDSVRKVYDHLKSIKKPKADVKIDLFLHSNGGDGPFLGGLLLLYGSMPRSSQCLFLTKLSVLQR
jgi:hypothetical protein